MPEQFAPLRGVVLFGPLRSASTDHRDAPSSRLSATFLRGFVSTIGRNPTLERSTETPRQFFVRLRQGPARGRHCKTGEGPPGGVQVLRDALQGVYVDHLLGAHRPVDRKSVV